MAGTLRKHWEDAVPVEVSIVIPTYNERDNIAVHVQALKASLAGIDWEAVYVDDSSPDGTAEVVRRVAGHDPRIRLIERRGRRGLSSACIEGLRTCKAPYLAVMDADLQHDADILPGMLAELKRGGDIVAGSRYVEGGGIAGWQGSRTLASRVATGLARMLSGLRVRDPLSGFFIIRREAFSRVAGQLDVQGTKILLDLMLSDRSFTVKEVPFIFRGRAGGQSKLSPFVIGDYFGLLLRKGVLKDFPCGFGRRKLYS